MNEANERVNEQNSNAGSGADTEVATLAGGCFWCLEAVYAELPGVKRVKSGYSGGHTVDPTYQEVCNGTTGHAEVVRIEYDPAKLSYEDLLGVFFSIHDPTTKDRQGHDIGSQYRSAIYTHGDEQARAARQSIAELETQGVYPDPVVTEVTEAGTFYPAEAYHDNYYARNPEQGYCQAVIAPKVAKFRKQYLGRLMQTSAGG